MAFVTSLRKSLTDSGTFTSPPCRVGRLSVRIKISLLSVEEKLRFLHFLQYKVITRSPKTRDRTLR